MATLSPTAARSSGAASCRRPPARSAGSPASPSATVAAPSWSGSPPSSSRPACRRLRGRVQGRLQRARRRLDRRPEPPQGPLPRGFRGHGRRGRTYDRGRDPTPDNKARVQALLGKLATVPHVANAGDPFSEPGAISADGRTALTELHLDVVNPIDMPLTDSKQMIALAERHPATAAGLAWRPEHRAGPAGGDRFEGIGLLAAISGGPGSRQRDRCPRSRSSPAAPARCSGRRARPGSRPWRRRSPGRSAECCPPWACRWG